MLRTRRWPDLLVLLLLLAGLVALFSPILFTDKIVRAPDILNEFYWGVHNAYGKPLWSLLRVDLGTADWNPYINSGHSNDGGMASLQFVYLYRLIFGLIPAPASVAWFMVLHLFLGGAGAYCYCRLVGCSRLAALFAGLLFAFCTENASLINAGHVMKIATIAHAPWVFYFLEKGFRTERLFPYLCAGLVLTLQFFNTHWQIAFYTCLAVGVYGGIRLLEQLFHREAAHNTAGRTLLLGTVMVLFFLVASAISLVPLASWSQDTNRGAHSGANQGKGGLARDEAMQWSLPPEEALALVVPGIFGLSRQEGGDQPRPDQTYYWGRMIFTQTASYFGLLPWLLLPLPLIFRNDRITWTALIAVIGGILFSMGKYTPFYQLLYEYLPGISRFRVPKMMLFISAFGLALLTARGIDLLRDEQLARSPRLRFWLWWVLAFPLGLALLLGAEKLFGAQLRSVLMDLLARPTRYQSGAGLVSQRWFTIEQETGMALAQASLLALLLLAVVRRRLAPWLGISCLLLVLSVDLWRVNRWFLVLTDPPVRSATARTPAMQWLRQRLQQEAGGLPLYRVLTLGDRDPMPFAAAQIPVLFTSNAVQKVRWQEYLDRLSLQSALPDIMNLRWVIYDLDLYQQNRAHFGERYPVVFSSGNDVVLENRRVLPKAWLLDHVELVPDPAQRLQRMLEPDFDPSRRALVESAPPLQLAATGHGGTARVQHYDAGSLTVTAATAVNSLLVLGEKYYPGWRAAVDGRPVDIVPVNHVLRGVYLSPGRHQVAFHFDPLPFKIGKWLTLGAFLLFMLAALREWRGRRLPHVG